MNSEVFVDTSAWVGLFASRDQHHAAAVDAFEGLRDARRRLSTTDYILTETVSRMRRQSGLEEAERAWDELESGRLAQLDPVDRELRDEARRIFGKYRQIDLSIVDCTSIAAMRRMKVAEIFTFDAGFRKAGLRSIP